MKEYNFNPEKVFNTIKEVWENFAKQIHTNKFVIGISGGKDSTVIAYLASKIFGKENIYGVMMPNGVQKDIDDARKAISLTGINSYAIDINNAYNAILDQLHYNGLKESTDTTINLPPRLRMSILYAIAQTINGAVICSDNLSEFILGYSTFGGDGFGSFAPLKDLTVTEVVALGDWLGIPSNLCHKIPSDGLQDKTDEDRLGIKYADLDNYIRCNEGSDEFKTKINSIYSKNKFKGDIVNVPYPQMNDYPNFVFSIFQQ